MEVQTLIPQQLFDFLGNNPTIQAQIIEKPPSSCEMHVFSTKHSTQMDWCAASNEPLFSIHINNCSYSKDQFFILYKSGELTKLDEQIIAQKDVLPSLKELDDMAARDEDIDQGSVNAATEVETGEVAEDESEPKVAQPEEVQTSNSNGPVVVNLSMEKKPTDGAHNKPINSLSNLSEESNISISFTFPVLTAADGGRLSSACAGQNNKGFPAQHQQPQEKEEEQQQQKEFTKEMEPESSFSPSK
ncbi:hypothetical protein HRI_000441300 [Hibiscus trionum]|uniref:Uncharacterized protein n=1 Tax=Hibiscus trionum TaxID=183268 RepID=A0A9W7H1G2_HIBTR|nr:hypothetical protein HRI_000441300 [Hibiscus trionum]